MYFVLRNAPHTLEKDILWMAEYVALKPVCTFQYERCLHICAGFATYFPLYCCVTCKILLRGINILHLILCFKLPWALTHSHSITDAGV